MAKYDWQQLEKEFILSDYKTVSAFLRSKSMNCNDGNIKKNTIGWKEKKAQKQHEKSTKIIEKVIEKQSEVESNQIVDIKALANNLAINIMKANAQLEQYIVKSKKKTKKVKYDSKSLKPSEEKTEETEEINILKGIIDRQGLKMLTSALKDLNDILTDKEDNSGIDKAKEILVKIREVAENDRN